MDIHENIWISMKILKLMKLTIGLRCVEGVIKGRKACANNVRLSGLSNAEIHLVVSHMV